jgi:outer membrane receptor protein involved in Fe transport
MNYTRNLDAGFRLKLPHDWSVEGDYTWNQSVSTAIFYNYDFTAWSAALASGALDLFKDTLAYPPNVDPYYYWATQFDPATLNDVAFRSSGPIGSLPGGAPTLSMSFEKRKEGNGGAYSYSPTKAPADVSATYFIGQVETATSTYAEFEIPVIGGKNALPGVKLLDLQIAGRLEWFGVKTTKVAGSTSTTSYAFITGGAPNPTPLNTVHAQAKYNSGNPTFGARYKPFDDLMFRASYATAFLPPTYGQLIPGLQSLTTTNVVDPRRGNATTPVYTISGGNPNIHPESDKNWNGGVVFTPHALPGLRASVDFVHIVKRNDISTLSAALMVANESAFPDRVIRGPVPAGDPYGVGPITVVNITSINLYETSIDMYNMELDYRKETAGWGTFNLSALATRGMHYKQQLTLALPFYDYARFPSIGGPLAWKGNVNLTWDYGRWTVGWSARFASEYNEYVGTTSPTAVYVTELGGLRVPSQMYHDVFVTYKMPSAKAGAKWWEKALSRTDIQLGIKDVFNSVPPFDSFFQSTTYYSPVISDMRLRDFMVSVKKSF